MKKNRILTAVLAMMLLFTAVPGNISAKEEEFTVVVSMEGLTLGQGFYVEPKAYTLDEINALIAGDGYGPYTQEDLTAGMATLAFLIDNNLEYTMTGSWDSDAYLSGVKGIDKGYLDIPAVITENSGVSNEENDGQDDEYLSEFDYNSMAGWMITVNDFLINVGCAAWNFEDGKNQDIDGYDLGNTYVVRWQFTLAGYGADLGVENSWGSPAYFTAAKKAPLYAAYAKNTDSGKKNAALAVMENLTATQTETDSLLALLTGSAEPEKADYKPVFNQTMAQLAVTVSEPQFGTGAGEWSVLALARGGYYPLGNRYYTDYYARIENTVREKAVSVNMNGALHKVKSTENARLIMTLSAIGMNPARVGGVDLIGAYSANGFGWITKQGINGPVFALIALDAKNYQTADSTIRQQCIDYILSKELSSGGWALSGSSADPDMTAMTLQALAKYSGQTAVAAAAQRGFSVLSSIQQANGGYASWGSVNSESIAQVIVACTAWGIDPDTDSRFVKNGNSVIDALLAFYIPENKGFAHVLESGGGYTGGEVNGMATDQACYALAAYDRFVNHQNSLYDMTDATVPEIKLAATLTLPEKTENKTGTEFNAVVNLNGFKDGYRLLDGIIAIPEGLTVTGVTMGPNIGGGQVCYHFDSAENKLRIVYFDAQGGNTVTAGENNAPFELLTIGLALEKQLDREGLTVSVTGMSLKQSSDSETQIVIDTSDASDSVLLTEGVSFSVATLYTGDGVDLIPADKTAVAIAVTGIEPGQEITYADSEGNIPMYYNAAVSEKTGVSTYIAMIRSGRDLTGLINEENYALGQNTADTITFGDTNSDGVINAQDALNSVNMWLRKTGAPSDKTILATNVTADSRLNTFDALGIVEYFVNGDEFAVINRAATVKNEGN